MEKAGRIADGKSGYFPLQGKNIFVSGDKQISLGLLRKVNEHGIGRVAESVYGRIRAMYGVRFQKRQYISK